MKKLLFSLIISFSFLNFVYADSFILPSMYSKEDYSISISQYNSILSTYQNYKSTYPYFVTSIQGPDHVPYLYGLKSASSATYYSTSSYSGLYIGGDKIIISYSSGSINTSIDDDGLNDVILNSVSFNDNGVTSTDIDLNYFDSNINITFDVSNFSFDTFVITGFYSDSITFSNKQVLPKLKDLLDYDSWSDYENNNLVGYTTVNLDNYDYVLLSLKDYSQSQPFQTNLQVLGQIGITPIYNYGQSSKDSVTGSQVQDRCNVSYSYYTSYPFYIIQSDLQNNVIYAVKSCQSGSSFKFDSNIFDVTYITADNSDDPTVTINGKTYDVIPYDDLPSTATTNEDNNYIPGQSGSSTSSGGIDSAIKSIQQSLSTLWNTFTYFTDFVGLIFSSLPTELRTILLSAFVVAITIGLIKIFVGH